RSHPLWPVVAASENRSGKEHDRQEHQFAWGHARPPGEGDRRILAGLLMWGKGKEAGGCGGGRFAPTHFEWGWLQYLHAPNPDRRRCARGVADPPAPHHEAGAEAAHLSGVPIPHSEAQDQSAQIAPAPLHPVGAADAPDCPLLPGAVSAHAPEREPELK